MGHPLDTVKVHMQMPGSPYSSTMGCLRDLAAKGGLRGLYRGLSSPMGGVAGVNAMVFGVYGGVQRRLPEPDSLRSSAMAGGAAGLAQSFICSPVELAKTRLQLGGGNQGPIACLAAIARAEGPRGLFRGLGLTALRDAPGLSTYFLSYELLTRTPDGSPSGIFHTLMAGGLAGVFSWLVSFPVDVVKSRVQADGLDGPRRYTGAVDCVRQSVAAEGYGFLTRGLGSVLLRAFPTNAACFGAVTLCMRMAGAEGSPINWNILFTPNNAAHAYRSLVFTGAFSEAICAMDIIDLHEDFHSLRPEPIERYSRVGVPLQIELLPDSVVAS